MSNKQVFSSPANVVFASRTPARVIPLRSRHAFAKPHRRASRNIYTVSAEPPYPEQKQPGHTPGSEKEMSPRPDFGEETYKGHGKLEGKVALVTGADSGIGRAIALAFAREGADIAIAYWNEHDDAKETQQWVEKAGRKSLLIDGNLAEEATCRKYIDATVQEFGKIDLLVNNASMQEDLQESFIDIPRSRLENTFAVNILAMFTLAQMAAKRMLEQGSGNIINIGSIQAYMPTPGILDYASTKGAITTMTKGIAMELASKGVRCNVIAPGPVWTPLVVSSFPSEMTKSFGAGGGMEVPMKRPGQPKDYQGPAVFLASDDSAYVTGSVQNVTGGMIIG